MTVSTFTFSALKKVIKLEKNKAKKEAKKNYPVVISRGNEFGSYINQESVEDGDRSIFTTKKELMALIDEAMKKGVTRIVIEGYYDGYDSVHDVKDGCCIPMVSEWYFELWNSQEGYCFIKPESKKEIKKVIRTENKETIKKVFKTDTFFSKDQKELFCVMEEKNDRVFLCEEVVTGRKIELPEASILVLINQIMID